MAFIHGWRHYTIGRCTRTDELCLIGAAGKHVHSSHSPHAECLGFSQAMWMTPGAQALTSLTSDERPRHEPLLAPVFECTCGYYGYRTWKALKKDHPGEGTTVGHVTAIEDTVLHTEGFRAQMYLLDYLVEPQHWERKIDIFSRRGQPGPYYGVLVEILVHRVALEEIAERLGVPILKHDDLTGCPDCLVVNGWRTEAEVAPLRAAWYGVK